MTENVVGKGEKFKSQLYMTFFAEILHGFSQINQKIFVQNLQIFYSYTEPVCS